MRLRSDGCYGVGFNGAPAGNRTGKRCQGGEGVGPSLRAPAAAGVAAPVTHGGGLRM